MADSDDASQPAEPPKPVHIGGESIADRILPHIKKILVMFIVVAVVISAILVVRWRKQVRQEVATEQLAEVLAVARRPVGPEETVIPPAPAATEPRFATPKERADAVLATLTTSGAKSVPYYKAALLLDAGKLDEAIAEYRAGTTAKGLDGVIAREGLGVALETKAAAQADPAARQQLLEEALAAFTAMQPDEKGPRRGYALYHQGRLQLALGKRDEAKASFEKAKEAAASTELPELIDRRLAVL
jgi:predicted negative regulator of RcsB-dependent stress response